MFRLVKLLCCALFLFICFFANAQEFNYRAKNANPEVLSCKVSQRGAFDVFEIVLSSKARVLRQKQSAHYTVFQIVPMLKPVSFNIWRSFKNNFTKFQIDQRAGYTEIFLTSSSRLGSIYTEDLPGGGMKIIAPKLVRQNLRISPMGKEIAAGMRYFHDIVTVGGVKQTHVFVIKLEPKAITDSVFPVLAYETVSKRERVLSMANRHNALCGINAGFYAFKGDPLGTLIINRKLLSSPIYNRSVFGITDDNKIVFGNPEFSGRFKTDGASISIDGVNQPRRAGTLVVYTPEYAKTTMTEDDGVELILVKGKIVGIQNKNSAIPPDGVVVSAGGEKAQMLKKVKLGAKTDINYSVDEPWNTIKHAVCGGPRLLKDGDIAINGDEEHFNSDLIAHRHPRTAVGITFNGTLIFLVANGRSKESAGMTLLELAEYMQKIGVKHAINLDGGGSSTMVIKGKVVNSPSEGTERAVSNGILVVRP